jgi:hypothetical protein
MATTAGASSSGGPVQELQVGPFAGGINTFSDPAAIADDEMVDCVNFDINLDGSLKSRPPWSLMFDQHGTNSSEELFPPECYQLIIGTGVYQGDRFIVLNSSHTGASAAYLYFVDGPNAGVLAKLGDGSHSKVHRYNDDLYIVPDILNPGKGLHYDLNGGEVTVIATMPTGYASVIYKDRLFIGGRRNEVSNTSRLFFSDLADFTSWPDENFFDINPGDGDAVNELVIYQDNVVIFKDNATYVLTYDSGPDQAVLQVINTDIGAMGPRCVDVYENSIFVLKYNKVYEMSNYDFTLVSVKIPFDYDHTFPSGEYNAPGQFWKYPFWLRVVGDRAVVRFYNRIYIYHLRIRGWTRWDSDDPNIKYMGPIMRLDNTNTDLLRGFQTYVSTSTLAINVDFAGPGVPGTWNMYFKIFQMFDKYDDTTLEDGDNTPSPVDISLSMMSKQFDVGLSHRFKRLMHWGVNCFTGSPVTGTLFPYSVAYHVAWSDLAVHHWHELNTWDFPLTSIPSVTQEVTEDSGIQIKFVRFPKSLRFRLLQFKIDMSTVGNSLDGPAFIYSLTAFISAKQLVPKAVN